MTPVPVPKVIMEERSGVWWVVTTTDGIDSARRFDFENTARYFFVSEQIRVAERPIPIREYAKGLLETYRPDRAIDRHRGVVIRGTPRTS